jgi:UDP-N-acetylglucosamine 2-epimerase
MYEKKLKIISVIGARPQFIKASPIELTFSKSPQVEFYSIHTCQHYDTNKSDIFFNQLKLNQPNKTLENGCNTIVFDDLNEIKTILKTENLHFDNSLYGTANASKIIAERIIDFTPKA